MHLKQCFSCDAQSRFAQTSVDEVGVPVISQETSDLVKLGTCDAGLVCENQQRREELNC